jgi:hypothetical protein
MRSFRITAAMLMVCCLLTAIIAAPATAAWIKVPNPPDQDKAGVPPGPPNPLDMTCWLATAANMLTAAGYQSGAPGGDPAGIYGRLTNRFGFNQMGTIDQALNWYLGAFPMPGNPYTVVTRYQGPAELHPTFIALELRRCQFVGIEIFDFGGQNPDHTLTVWGDELNQDLGNPPQQPATLEVTDSDRDANGLNVNTYNWTQVVIGGNNIWAVKDYYTWPAPGGHGVLTATVTLCPVPEPGTMVALVSLLAPMGLMFRRRK